MATKILEAKKILEEYAPAGEFLAYISKEEAELLKSLGSSGTPVEETGIPSFQLPGYLEDTAKDYAKQATAAYSVPIDTSKFTGQQFVAGEDPLQTSAINLAQQGVGSYTPYLSAAQAGLTQAGTDVGAARTAAGGLGALTGPTAYQPFMSPYQQDVIDTSLTEFDRQAKMQQQGIREPRWESPVPLAEDVKAFSSLNTKQAVIEIEPCFKQDYYNKVMVKHKWELNKLSLINKPLPKVNWD